MKRSPRLLLAVAALAVLAAACLPVSVPGLRNIHNQTWSARFEVEVRPAGLATIRLPVDLAMTFSQRLQTITANATLQHDTGIFRLETGTLVTMEGRLGLDDRLQLTGDRNLIHFDGWFAGDRLVGTVSIAGLVPVTDVVLSRTR